MIHQNVDLYICEHCRLEFYDEEECLSTKKPTRLISMARRTRTSLKSWTRSVLTLAAFGLEIVLWG